MSSWRRLSGGQWVRLRWWSFPYMLPEFGWGECLLVACFIIQWLRYVCLNWVGSQHWYEKDIMIATWVLPQNLCIYTSNHYKPKPSSFWIFEYVDFRGFTLFSLHYLNMIFKHAVTVCQEHYACVSFEVKSRCWLKFVDIFENIRIVQLISNSISNVTV